jgi:hypothetical protein
MQKPLEAPHYNRPAKLKLVGGSQKRKEYTQEEMALTQMLVQIERSEMHSKAGMQSNINISHPTLQARYEDSSREIPQTQFKVVA